MTATATATTAAIKARNELLIGVLNEMPEEDVRRLITICEKSIPDNVNFVDGAILVSVLAQIGMFNLHDGNDRIDLGMQFMGEFGWWYKTNDKGRITVLAITKWPDTDPFDLPAMVAKFGKLIHIEVENCRSLPSELTNLLHLQTLEFTRCSDLLKNIPVQMQLKNLKKIHLTGCVFKSSSPFLAWMKAQLPNLEFLELRSMEKIVTNCILDALIRTDVGDVSFGDNLKKIKMMSCKLDETHLETLLFDILPKFPNIFSLDLNFNRIESVQSIADRLKKDNDSTYSFVSKSIRFLQIRSNPIMTTMKNDPKEKIAVVSLLQTFNSICNLGAGYNDVYDSEIEYALRINHARQGIIVGGGGGDSCLYNLPLSMWPTALRRVYEASGHIFDKDSDGNVDCCLSGRNKSDDSVRKKKNATGIYYLIRNGPALIGRTDISRSSNNARKKKKESCPPKRKIIDDKIIKDVSSEIVSVSKRPRQN